MSKYDIYNVYFGMCVCVCVCVCNASQNKWKHINFPNYSILLINLQHK
jgi:hypothetical protein